MVLKPMIFFKSVKVCFIHLDYIKARQHDHTFNSIKYIQDKHGIIDYYSFIIKQ